MNDNFGGNYLINTIRILQWPKRYLYDCHIKWYGKCRRI